MKLGEFVGRQRETNVQRETTVANTPSLVPDEPARNSAGRRSRSALKKQPARVRAAHS
jgi:hypothetical protein